MTLEQAKKTVVKITVNGNFAGTGFFIAQDKVLTNAHVIADVQAHQIKAGGLNCVEILAKRKDNQSDYAVLQVSGLATEIVTADFEFEPAVNEQQTGKFFGFGAEFMNEPTAFDARILSVYQGGRYELQVQPGLRQVLPGDSGSPLFYGDRAIGLLFARQAGDTTKAYAYLFKDMPQIRSYFENIYTAKEEKKNAQNIVEVNGDNDIVLQNVKTNGNINISIGK